MYWLWMHFVEHFRYIFLMRGPFFLIFSPASPENNANRSGWPDFWLVFPINRSVARGMSLKRACNVLTLNHFVEHFGYIFLMRGPFFLIFSPASPENNANRSGWPDFWLVFPIKRSVARGMSLKRARNVLTLNHLLSILGISSLCVGRFSSSFHQRLLKTMPIDRVDQISD